MSAFDLDFGVWSELVTFMTIEDCFNLKSAVPGEELGSLLKEVLQKRSNWTASALTRLELKNLSTLTGDSKISALTFKGGDATIDYNALIVQSVKLFGESLQILRYEGDSVPSLSKVASGAIIKHASRLVKLEFNIGKLARDEMIDLARG